MFELIMDWIVEPLLDMLCSKRLSGKWRFYYLFPVATALGIGMWWAGDHFGIIPLAVFGVLTALLCGLISVLTFIPREVQFWQDLKDHRAKQERELEARKSKKEKEDPQKES